MISRGQGALCGGRCPALAACFAFPHPKPRVPWVLDGPPSCLPPWVDTHGRGPRERVTPERVHIAILPLRKRCCPLLGGMQQRRSAKPGKEAMHAKRTTRHPQPAGPQGPRQRIKGASERTVVGRISISLERALMKHLSGVGNSRSIDPSSLLNSSFLNESSKHIITSSAV